MDSAAGMVQPEEIDLYQRLHAEFEACRLLDRPAQEMRVKELLGTHPTLARELERLLHAAPDPDDPSSSGSSNSDDPLSDKKIDEARGPASWLSPETARSEPPKQVGPFHILRELGAGGMGTVYEAEQTHPRRRVALKLIHPGLDSDDRLRRFRQEGEALARLQHPGIAQVYQVASADLGSGEQPYLVMELVPGTSLRNYSKRAKLDPRAKLALVAEICDAVQHAHERGVVHRDLKPDNVLVDDDGRAKVLDFGIAQVAPGEIPLTTIHTRQGELVGTLTHMAPEQMEGDSDRVGPPADIYALGVIAFELLTGRLPHEIAGLPIPQAIRQITDQPAPRLGKIDRALRGDPETIVGKALDQDPNRRYATASALASDLRRFLRHEPITARPPSAIYLAASFTLRHRGFVAGTLLSLIAIVVGFVAVIGSRQSVISARDAETKARISAEQVGIDALASSYLATHSTLENGDGWAAREQLDRVQREQRGWEWRWLDARAPLILDGLQPRFLAIQDHYVAGTPEDSGTTATGPVVVVDLTHPSKRTRVSGLDAAFAPINPLGGPALARTRGPTSPENPTGGHLAASAIIDLPTASVLEFIQHDTPAPANLQSPWYAHFITARGTVAEIHGYRFRISTQKERDAGATSRPSPDYSRTVYPSLNEDETLALLLSREGRCRIVSTADFADVAILDLDVNNACAFDRKGARVARLRDSGLLEILEVPTLEVLHQFQLPGGKAESLYWTHDDEWFLANMGLQTILIDSTSGAVLEKYDSGTSQGLRTISQGGRYIALCGGKRYQPWIVEPRSPPTPPYRELRGHTRWVYHVAISPDGSLIASIAPEDPHLRLWDGWTGKPLGTLPRDMNPALRDVPLAFSDDGGTVVTMCSVDGVAAITTYDLGTGVIESFDSQEGWTARYQVLQQVFGDLAGRRISGGIVGHPDGRRVFHSLPSQGGDSPLALDAIDARDSVTIGTAQGIGLSPNGKLLAVGEIGGFRLLRTSDLELVSTHRAGAKLARKYAVAWSPDGQRIALGDEQGQTTIVETKHFRPIMDLPRHDDYVYSMVWSPDGTRLITASGDKTLRIHDTLHGIPFRLRAEGRAKRAKEQLAKLDSLVAKLGSVPVAIEALVAGAKGDEATEIAARRACLLRWTREKTSDEGP